MTDHADELLGLLNARGCALDPATDDWDDVVSEYIGAVAAQAREQALLEAQEKILGMPFVDYNLDRQDPAEVARKAVASLTTPTAQAEVRKRIVAEWLEDQLVNARDRYNENPNHDDDRRAGAATNLLAALKEQE